MVKQELWSVADGDNEGNLALPIRINAYSLQSELWLGHSLDPRPGTKLKSVASPPEIPFFISTLCAGACVFGGVRRGHVLGKRDRPLALLALYAHFLSGALKPLILLLQLPAFWNLRPDGFTGA